MKWQHDARESTRAVNPAPQHLCMNDPSASGMIRSSRSGGMSGVYGVDKINLTETVPSPV